MAYAPLLMPADNVPYTAAANILGGQVVFVSAANSVSPTTAATAAVAGVAAADTASGAQLTVYAEGVHPLTASGTISAGDPVVSAAAGAVATIAADTVYTHVIGKALTAATNGGTVNVRLSI